MRRAEIAFLGAVALFACVFAALSLTEAARVIARGAGEAAFSPTAGEPRDVDLQKLERLLRTRDLSDREALHYKRVEDDGD
ncbi:MAG: hypothetical protein ACYTEZ_14060 [Planctomycetota bacterium]|jgi:hypothetical protein